MSIVNGARKLGVFIIVAVIGVFGAVYALTQQPTAAPPNINEQTENQNQDRVQLVPGATVMYSGQDGRTALDLLKASHRVATKSTSFGEMVIGIDGVEVNESSQFWSFYVNGEMAQVGAATYQTKSTDTIEWKIESFK